MFFFFILQKHPTCKIIFGFLGSEFGQQIVLLIEFRLHALDLFLNFIESSFHIGLYH